MPNKIVLPEFLEGKLKDARYNYVVTQAIKDFHNWLGDSKMPFFEDYTDHGTTHIQEVLDTAVNLITPDSAPYFTPADATVLVLAVLFHDSALHLSEDGFYELIKGDYSKNFIPAFDKQNWQEVWQEFLFNARRWDEAKLLNVFGTNEETGGPIAQVRDPFTAWPDLTRSDSRLIGEFIRQHHPRIAHEMAIFGVPGNKGIAFTLNSEMPRTWRDLIGLVARSHGLPLRACVDRLSVNSVWGVDAKHEYQGVHAAYSMALLRIADYIQIQSSRSSELAFRYKRIPSRLSELEHKVHKSIIDIHNKTLDPESLRIDADPREVAVFLRLKEWLAGIQYELDASWAIFGEVYGWHSGLKHLGLAFRRIRSNLDDVQVFAETVDYVPDRIRFEASRAELLPLLLSPLYGDDPTYGVRELIQNSVDAVRELEQFLEDNAEYRTVERQQLQADVVVSLSQLDETGRAIMVISDRGAGMTDDIIRNYFLKAGASYRRSPEWRHAFETTSVSGQNVTKVLRSGRFGVGGLAAFLIGPEMEVQTRHITATEGYVFKTILNADLIEIKRNSKLPVGTTITITVNRESYYKLLSNTHRKYRPNFWDWYRFETPTVLRTFHDLEGNLHSDVAEYNIDVYSTETKWRKLTSSLPYQVFWTFDKAPALTCNGIYINDEHTIKYFLNDCLLRGDLLKVDFIKMPNVAIIDPEGYAPLNLKRSGFTTVHVPFSAEIIEDFLSEMLAWLLFNGPTSTGDPIFSEIDFSPWLSIPAASSFVAGGNGYALKLAVLFKNVSFKHHISLTPGMSIKPSDDTILSINGAAEPNNSGDFVNLAFAHPTDARAKKKAYRRRITYSFVDKPSEETPGSDSFLDYDLKSKIGAYKLPFTEGREGDWDFQVNDLKCPAKGFDIIKFPPLPNRSEFALVNTVAILDEFFYPEGTTLTASSEPWLLDQLWQRYFGLKWIPYLLKDRLAAFPDTFRSFATRFNHVVTEEVRELLDIK